MNRHRQAGRVLVLAVLLVAVGATPMPAQLVVDATEDLDDDRPEAWAMNWVGSALLPTSLGAVAAPEPWSVDLGLEASWMPSLSERERTVGFNGTKTEEINRTEVLARPRLSVGLPGGVTATLGYVPPIEIDGAEASVVSLSLARRLVDRDRWSLAARLVGQTGSIEGDITCSADDVAQGVFGCLEPSSDEMDLTSAGLDLVVSILPGRRWTPYASVGAHHFDNEFRVDARYGEIDDRTRLLAEDWVYTGTAGVDVDLGLRSRLAVEAFYAPLDVVRPPATGSENDPLFNVRALVGYRLR